MIADPCPNAKTPRVLIAGHLPPPMSGIGTYYQTLLSSSLPERANIQFIDTSSRRRVGSETGRWSISNLTSAIVDCFRFTKAVVKYRPEICHIATAVGLSFIKHSLCVVVARLMGCKVLLHPHCSFYYLYETQGKTWQWFVRKIVGLCQGVIVLSNEWGGLKEVVPDCPYYYLPNAINLESFKDVALEKLGSKSDKPCLHILYLGHLGKAKGSFDLIAAAQFVLKQEQGVVFDLVGHEQVVGDIKQLQGEVADFGFEQFVHIQPAVAGPEKIELFRLADIFIYPSYYEGMPMAVIEAMASGLPIIATQVGGLPDLVLPGVNGILVPVGQPERMAEAIRQLVADPEMRRSMQENSLRLAQENFDIEKLVSRLLEIYQSLALPRHVLTAQPG
jgi:glycosyltransferase involved in cell wall biosynthesis